MHSAREYCSRRRVLHRGTTLHAYSCVPRKARPLRGHAERQSNGRQPGYVGASFCVSKMRVPVRVRTRASHAASVQQQSCAQAIAKKNNRMQLCSGGRRLGWRAETLSPCCCTGVWALAIQYQFAVSPLNSAVLVPRALPGARSQGRGAQSHIPGFVDALCARRR